MDRLYSRHDVEDSLLALDAGATALREHQNSATREINYKNNEAYRLETDHLRENVNYAAANILTICERHEGTTDEYAILALWYMEHHAYHWFHDAANGQRIKEVETYTTGAAKRIFDRAVRQTDQGGDAGSDIYLMDMFFGIGLLAEAIDHWKQTPASRERLKLVAAWLNKRGLEYFNADAFGDALNSFGLAIRAREDDVAALNNAASCLKEIGRLGESTSLYERALALQPGFAEAQCGFLMNLHYTSGITAAMFAAAHRSWDERHASGFEKPASYRVTREPERALNIGIVSTDLGQHPVGIFLVRYLENIDRGQFRFTGYIDGRREGGLATRICAALHNWHNVHDLNDAALAQKIHADGIDILIDLNGHTAGNRLHVFARKPAPVQICWLGYPGDTGLAAMDYVIADRWVYPENLQPFSRSRIKHLPDSFVCFDPPTDAPPVNPLPAQVPGRITFGCLNNPAKCTKDVLGLWADILKQLPQSRLAFKYKGFGDALCRQEFEERFADVGIAPECLSFEGASSPSGLFAFLQTIDLALDPFPFAGGLMTCLTLWMGVPVLTLPSKTFAGRQGLSFLSNIGITETIAASREDYSAKAVALAQDLPHLQSLRQRLRPTMAASPLCDGKRAAISLQNLLREIWQDYCGGRS